MNNKIKCFIAYITVLILSISVINIIYKSKSAHLISRYISADYTILFTIFIISLLLGICITLKKRDALNKDNVFILSMSIAILSLICVGYFTHGEGIRALLHGFKTDVFMDFFNSIQYGKYPYQNQVIYPPLINVVYGFLGHFIIIGNNIQEVRSNQMGGMVYLIYTIISIASLSYCFFCVSKRSTKKNIIVLVCLLFSTPVLFALERGNSIVLAITFSMLFLIFYDSDVPKHRYFAYLCLGVAAGIKIVPAILGLLIIKRNKDIMLSFVIVSIVFLLPFQLLDGNIFSLINNLQYTTNLFHGATVSEKGTLQLYGQGVYVNFVSTIQWIERIFNINISSLGNYINMIIGMIAIALVMLSSNKKKWKHYGLLCGVLCLCPGFSVVYNLMYLMIPFIYFLEDKEVMSILDKVYLSLFIIMFIPMLNVPIETFNEFSNDYYPMTISTAIESCTLIMFMIVLEMDVAITLYKETSYKYKRTLTSILCGVLLVGYPVYGLISTNYIEAFYPNNLTDDRIVKGYTMENGMYAYPLHDNLVKLKDDKVFDNGILVTFDNRNNYSDVVGVYINGTLVKEREIDCNNNMIYIAPEEIPGDKNQILSIYFFTKSDEGIPKVKYIGACDPPSYIDSTRYVDIYSCGLDKQMNDGGLYIKKQATINLSKELVDKGFIIEYFISADLCLNNGQSEMKVFCNDELIETKKLNHIGRDTIVVPRSKCFEKASYLTLKFIIVNENGDYETIDDTVRIDYIGQPEKKKNYNTDKSEESPIDMEKIIGNKSFYFYRDDLMDDGLCLVYEIPNDFSLQDGVNYVMKGNINGVDVYKKNISIDDLGGLYSFYIPKEQLKQFADIIKININLERYTNTDGVIVSSDNQSLIIKYVGSMKDSEKLFKSKALSSFSKGLYYDKDFKTWSMGMKSDCIIFHKTESVLHIKYNVPKYLIEANQGKNIYVKFFVNEKCIEIIPLNYPGEYMLDFDTNELMIEDNSIIKITMECNATWSWSELKLFKNKWNKNSIFISDIFFD